MQEKRITLTQAELEAAFRVWLRVLPGHVWQRYVAFEKKRLDKRDRPEDRIDPRDEIARLLAAKFAQAHWQASYEKRGNLFGGPGPSDAA